MRRATCDALSASFRMRRASGRKLRPAGVRRTERLVRSRSGASMMCSSTWICRESGGWVMLSRAAARPKCSSSATVTKQRSWLRSNIDAGLGLIRRLSDVSSIDHLRNKDGGFDAAVSCLIALIWSERSGGTLEHPSLDLADHDEVGDRRHQRVDADEHQGTVERAGRSHDVADHDRGGDAGEIAEGVEQAAGDAAGFLRRGVGDDGPAERADALAEEGQRHEA